MRICSGQRNIGELVKMEKIVPRKLSDVEVAPMEGRFEIRKKNRIDDPDDPKIPKRNDFCSLREDAVIIPTSFAER